MDAIKRILGLIASNKYTLELNESEIELEKIG
jgi:hypothetical protein